MKKLFLLSVAAILSFTACKSDNKNANRIESDPYAVSTIGNDGTQGYQTIIDMLYDNGAGTIMERYVMWCDTNHLKFPAVASTYSVASEPYYLGTDGAGNVFSVPATNVAGFQGTKGTSTFSGLTLVTTYTVSHGLGYTPSQIILQPRSANAAALNWTSNYTSTTFRVNFLTIPVIGTNNITFDWLALK